MPAVRLFLLVSLFSFCQGAILHGNVLDDRFEPAGKAAVTLNTTPNQELFTSADGSYRFSVPPGSYRLRATRANSSAEKAIFIRTEGEYRIDLVLLPDLQEETVLEDSLGELPVGLLPEIQRPKPPFLTLALFALLAAALFWWFRLRKTRSLPEPKLSDQTLVPMPPIFSAPPSWKNKPLTSGQERVLKILGENQGRLAQKELRKILHDWSEARVSMELTELEERGLIQKLKKGRGNILRKNG